MFTSESGDIRNLQITKIGALVKIKRTRPL